MKTLATIAFFLGTSFLNSSSRAELQWYTLEEAQALMNTEPRKVFIDIVADWCKWCKVMEKETFTNPEVIAYIEAHYYPVRMDYASQDSVMFQGKATTYKALAYDWKVRDLPAIIFWDEGFDGKFLSTGYKNGPDFLKDLQAFNAF